MVSTGISHFRCVRRMSISCVLISQLLVIRGLLTALRSWSYGLWRDTMVCDNLYNVMCNILHLLMHSTYILLMFLLCCQHSYCLLYLSLLQMLSLIDILKCITESMIHRITACSMTKLNLMT